MDTHEAKFFLMNQSMDAFIDEDGEETDDISDAVSSEERVVVENTLEKMAREFGRDTQDFAVAQLVRRSS